MAKGDEMTTVDYAAKLLAAAPQMVEELQRARVLLQVLTVRDIIRAGDEAIEASGLNPWCVNEGADPNARFDPWRISALLRQVDPGDNDD